MKLVLRIVNAAIFLSSLSVMTTSLAFDPCNPHYFRFGANTFYRHYVEGELPPLAKSREIGWVVGGNIGYDYLKPDTFYFGTDAYIDIGRPNYDGSVEDENNQILPLNTKSRNLIFDIEARLGYTFVDNCKTLITPFLGIGYHFWHFKTSPVTPLGYNDKYSWRYLSGGVMLLHSLSKNYDVGLNLKTMMIINGRMVEETVPNAVFHLRDKWQVQAEVPLTYYFEASKPCNTALRLTPFYIYRQFDKSDYDVIYTSSGVTILNDPESVNNSFGIRLEAIVNY